MSASVLAEGHSISSTAVLQEMVGVVTCLRLCQIAKEKLLWQFQCSVQEFGSKKKTLCRQKGKIDLNIDKNAQEGQLTLMMTVYILHTTYSKGIIYTYPFSFLPYPYPLSNVLNLFLAATELLYNSLCLSVGQTFSHDDVNRIEAKPLKIESSNLECSLI